MVLDRLHRRLLSKGLANYLKRLVKGGEKVDHYGGGIVYHRHDER